MGSRKTKKEGPANIKIGVRRETHDKYKAAARLKKWSLVTVADAAIDALMANDPELKNHR